MRSSGSFGKPCQKNGKPSEARCQTTSGSSLTTNFGFWGENSIDAGMDDYIAKPIRVDLLTEALLNVPAHRKDTL
jgi:CheY-like chemotaxis protein